MVTKQEKQCVQLKLENSKYKMFGMTFYHANPVRKAFNN